MSQTPGPGAISRFFQLQDHGTNVRTLIFLLKFAYL